MSSKKKLIISLSVAAAVLVAAIIAIVAVFAAAQQNVQSNITVQFKSKNVDCSVKAEYQRYYDTSATLIGSETFASTEAKTSKALSPDNDITIEDQRTKPEDDVYLDLIYTITNTSVRDLVVKITNIKAEGLEVSYTVDGSVNTTLDSTGVTISGGNTTPVVFVVRATLTEETLNSKDDASFSIEITWDLSAAYTAPTPDPAD